MRSIYIGDSQQYAWDYDIYRNNFGKGQFEIGFSMLEKLCAQLNFSVTIFFIIVAILSFLFLSSGFKNLTIFPTSALLYYYSRFYINRDMNQIRAALAASIILFSLQYLVHKKDLFKFFGLILLATLIHKAAFVALILYPVTYFVDDYMWNLNRKKKVLIYITILIISFLLSKSCSGIISDFIGNFDTTYVSRTSDYGKISYGLSNPIIWLQFMVGLFILLSSNDKDNKKLKIQLGC